jgi:hypothetical protein
VRADSRLCLAARLSSSALRFLPDYLARAKWSRLRGFLRESVAVSVGVSTLGAVVGAVLILTFKSSVESYYLTPLLIGLTCIPATALLIQMESTARAFGWLHTAFVPGYIVRPLLPMAVVYALSNRFWPTAVQALWALAVACLLASLVQALLVLRGVGKAVPVAKRCITRITGARFPVFVTIDSRQILKAPTCS